MMLYLAILAASILPHDRAIRSHCHEAEINHYFSENGDVVFDQIIFRDYDRSVMAWRLVKQANQIPVREWTGCGFAATWMDSDQLRTTYCNSVQHTWTQAGFQGDPELNERSALPPEKRKGFRSYRTNAKITGRGSANFRIPKHEQPVKEVAMSGNESSCAAPVLKSETVVPFIMNGVEYRQIPGFSRYYAGDDGSVGTFIVKGNPRRTDGPFRLMRQTKCKATGYLSLTVSSDSHCKTTVTGHWCVLTAFVGPRPDGMEGCHDPDPCRSNNRLSNLRWDTRKSNHADKWKHGTQQAGSQSAQAVLNESEVLAIKHRIVAGETLKAIAADYGVDWTTIGQIRRGRNWSHIAPELHDRFPPSYRSRRFGVDLTKLAKEHGISSSLLYLRLQRGLTLDEALAPVNTKRLPKDDPRRIAAETGFKVTT